MGHWSPGSHCTDFYCIASFSLCVIMFWNRQGRAAGTIARARTDAQRALMLLGAEIGELEDALTIAKGRVSRAMTMGDKKAETRACGDVRTIVNQLAVLRAEQRVHRRATAVTDGAAYMTTVRNAAKVHRDIANAMSALAPSEDTAASVARASNKLSKSANRTTRMASNLASGMSLAAGDLDEMLTSDDIEDEVDEETNDIINSIRGEVESKRDEQQTREHLILEQILRSAAPAPRTMPAAESARGVGAQHVVRGRGDPSHPPGGGL